jgi:YidC/Oxa1 family membrane protein insertase
MNDIRRSILWVIFGFSLIMLWDAWQVHNGRPATFLPKPDMAATATAPGASPASPASSVPSASVPAASGAPTGTAAGVPAANAPSTVGALPSSATAPAAPTAQTYEVTTDVLKLTFSSQGGKIVRAELLQHRELDAKKDRLFTDRNVVLLDNSKDRAYEAQTGLVGLSNQAALPNHLSSMSFSGDKQLAEGKNELQVRFESAAEGGVKYVKTYTVKRSAYDIGVKHEIINTTQAAVSAQMYLQLVRDGNKPPGESAFYSTFTGPVVYTAEKKYQKIEFKNITDKPDFQAQSATGYIAMVQHYFGSAWLLPDGVARDNYVDQVPGEANLYRVGTRTAMQAIAPGATQVQETRLFIGPQEEKKLQALYPGLELIKDYGYFTILAKPLYWLMDKLHAFIGNWGWSIIALVLLLKAAFYWLNASAYRSMAKMKAVNPKIMEMRERLKDKPQQMQQEMMKIYREEKVNPMGGCFPILIQIPVFIALYWVLLSSVEVRGAPWIGWITDLSVPDPWYILPVVMAATTMLQTALNPAPPDPLQAKLMWYMPLAFSIMFFFFPAGLVLYWITNNILSIAQQWLINKSMGVPPQFNLPWKKKTEAVPAK